MILLGAFAVVVLGWDVVLAGHMAQLRSAPRTLAVLSAFAALLIAPAIVVTIADAGGVGLESRTVTGVAWVWPLTVALVAAQALYATLRRLVTPLIGLPIVAYDLLLFAVAVTRYLGSDGSTPPSWALTLGAAYVTALGVVVGPTALSSPYVLLVPMIAPAFPARWRVVRTFRALVAVAALGWVGLTAASVSRAAGAVESYDRYATEPLDERAPGDFSIGVRVLPPVTGLPAPVALRNDLSLVDSVGAEVVSVVVDPDGTRPAALDSVARALEQLRRDSTILIVTLGYPHVAVARFRRSPAAYDAARIGDVERIARRLDPDYLLPADEPYGHGAHALGRRPVAYWERYLTDAAIAAHRIDRRIKVAVSIAAFDADDSTLYAWAAAPDSPLDAVGFTLFPEFDGAASLDARLHTADRWLHSVRAPAREQWVFAAGGYPVAHGDDAQQRAVWGTLSWASSRSAVKGVIVSQAADYGALTGLRAANGRLRPVVGAIAHATRMIKESTP